MLAIAIILSCYSIAFCAADDGIVIHRKEIIRRFMDSIQGGPMGFDHDKNRMIMLEGNQLDDFVESLDIPSIIRKTLPEKIAVRNRYEKEVLFDALDLTMTHIDKQLMTLEIKARFLRLFAWVKYSRDHPLDQNKIAEAEDSARKVLKQAAAVLHRRFDGARARAAIDSFFDKWYDRLHAAAHKPSSAGVKVPVSEGQAEKIIAEFRRVVAKKKDSVAAGLQKAPEQPASGPARKNGITPAEMVISRLCSSLIVSVSKATEDPDRENDFESCDLEKYAPGIEEVQKRIRAIREKRRTAKMKKMKESIGGETKKEPLRKIKNLDARYQKALKDLRIVESHSGQTAEKEQDGPADDPRQPSGFNYVR